MIRRWAFFFYFFCILIPSCIGRTDVGRLINKSLGDVEVRLRVQRLREGREDVLLDHTQSASQCTSMHVSLDCVCVCVHGATFTLSLLMPCFWSAASFLSACETKVRWADSLLHFLLTRSVISSRQQPSTVCYFMCEEASYYCFDNSDKSNY